MTFDDLNLAPEIMRAINDVGYTTPTPIQSQAIPEVINGRDVLGIAQTGTGKTASFTLPMIHRLMKGRAKARMPRTLILEPTRELASQVAENFDLYGKYTKLSKALLIGGMAFGDQEKAIERGADVLIATPGRLLDHVERGKVMLRGVEILVIDEADRMLDMGFIPDIERIVKLLPFTRQTLFFSATMPPEITRLSDQFLQAPIRIEVARASSTSDTVAQHTINVGNKLKREALRSMFQTEDIQNAIIFCNRKRDIGTLVTSLKRHGFDACALHGDMDQHSRLRTLDMFRNGETKYLIASDVAARGLDIPEVSHVFNFDVPIHAEDYVHRIGRTGRAGRSGRAFTIVTPEDSKYWNAILALTEKPVEAYKIEGLGLSDKESSATPKAKPQKDTKADSKNEKKGAQRRGLLAKASPTIAKDQETPSSTESLEEKSEQVAQDDDMPKPKKPRRAKKVVTPPIDVTTSDDNHSAEKTDTPNEDSSNNIGKDAFDGAMPAFLKIDPRS